MFWHLTLPIHFAISFVLSGVLKEERQPCSSGDFSCPDGACVRVQRVCDGVSDCADGFDEDVCRPGAKSEWPCRDGTCIPFYGKCDGAVDCPDGSDETHPLCRHTVCPGYLFRCTYGACADGTAACNGIQECADNSDELQPNCLNDTRIDKGQYRCDNGQQVSVVGLCDGERDCADGSDETIQACAGNTCDTYLLQCAYGACVDAGSNCNGKQDCVDGSDESDELCNRTVGSNTASTAFDSPATCLLPAHPANGRYEVHKRPSARPGQQFKDVVFINVTCSPGYAVDGDDSQILPCFPDITDLSLYVPKCTPSCHLPPHPSVDYECLRQDGKGTLSRRCGVLEFVGTKVVPTCRKPNYRGSPPFMYCTEGGWNHIATCSPECGRTTPVGNKYIIDGKQVEHHGEIPWHAGVYAKTWKSYKQICGGSLVSTTHVITAAHCFWKDGEGLQSPEKYGVAIGKIYRDWANNTDDQAQFSNVTKIYIPVSFHGAETNYQDDIAIVKLENEIVYKPFIRPVCISYDQDLNKRQLQPHNYGKISGWGLTSANGKPSEVLRVVEMPFVSHEQCYRESPEDFHEYINSDKICAGFTNGTALCEGDSGGGLAFPDTEQIVQRYYLRGIVSTAPRNNQRCDPYQRTTFTEVFKHSSFIREHINII